MKRRITTLVVAILMIVAMIPSACFAANGKPVITFDDKWDMVEHEGEYLIYDKENLDTPLAFVKEQTVDSWAMYKDGTLTLHNFDAKVSDNSCEFWFTESNCPNMDLVLKLEGDNYIGCLGFHDPEYSHIDKLIITGSGNLRIKSPGFPCIFFIGSIVFDKEFTGTLELNGLIGIQPRDLTINNGNIDICATSEGIMLINDGFVKINGGDLNIHGGLMTAGIHVETGTFDITGGDISVDCPNGMAIYHNNTSGGGKFPTIKNGYLEYELTDDINKLTNKNAADVHSFVLNYTKTSETNPVDEPADPTTDPGEDPTVPIKDPDPLTENVNIYIAGGCGVLLIAIIVILVVKKKRKKQ